MQMQFPVTPSNLLHFCFQAETRINYESSGDGGGEFGLTAPDFNSTREEIQGASHDSPAWT